MEAMQPTPKNNCGILLLGDSIRMGYCGFVREAMKERADIFWPEGNCMFAHYTLRFLYRQISCQGEGNAVPEATV